VTGSPAAVRPELGAGPLAPPRSTGAAVALAVAAGVALRLALALRLGSAAEWEADAFVTVLAGFGASGVTSGLRPAGLQSLWQALGWLSGGGSLLAVRTGFIAVSLLSLWCAWVLVRVELTRRSGGPGALLRARLMLALGWAVFPSLVAAGARPVSEMVAGGSACLAIAGFLRFGMKPALVTWASACVAGALWLSLGGVVAAVGLAAGLVAWLVPLPRVSRSVAVLAATAVAFASAYGVARCQGSDRPWRPDAGPAYAVADLVAAPVLFDDRESSLPEVRSDAVWTSCWVTLRDHSLADAWSEGLGRARLLIAPSRFSELPDGPAIAVGLVDALLTGGALVLAAALLLGRPASAYRLLAGTAAGAAWVAATIAGASGPFALSGVVLVLLSLAVVTACIQPSLCRPPVRWVALAGALALAAAALVPARGDRPPSRWLDQLTQHGAQGRQLVALLSLGAELTAPEHAQIAQELMDPAAPFLRRPRLALEHAEAALAQLPDDPDTIAVLVRAEVECLQYARAEDLAETMLDDDGQLSVRGRMLAAWVRDKARRARLDGLR